MRLRGTPSTRYPPCLLEEPDAGRARRTRAPCSRAPRRSAASRRRGFAPGAARASRPASAAGRPAASGTPPTRPCTARARRRAASAAARRASPRRPAPRRWSATARGATTLRFVVLWCECCCGGEQRNPPHCLLRSRVVRLLFALAQVLEWAALAVPLPIDRHTGCATSQPFQDRSAGRAEVSSLGPNAASAAAARS